MAGKKKRIKKKKEKETCVVDILCIHLVSEGKKKEKKHWLMQVKFNKVLRESHKVKRPKAFFRECKMYRTCTVANYHEFNYSCLLTCGAWWSHEVSGSNRKETRQKEH